MRVAIDATALLDRPTGVGVFARELITGLGTRAGARGDGSLDVRLFCVSWRGRARLADVAPPGTTVRSMPVPARVARALWRRIDLPTATWLAGRTDVVHGPNFVVPPGRWRSGATGPAELVTVHDLTAVRFPQLCTPDTLAYPGLIRRALDRGAHVHAVSQFVADEVRAEFALDASRVTVIPNGVRSASSAPATAPAPAPGDGHRLAGGDRYVLAIGTVEPRKDLPGLVHAFDELATDRPELRLVLAGPDGWGAEALTEALSASPHRDRIARLGWVSDADRDALLGEASVLAYPSRYEGFGMPPLEAMAAGTPVVTTDSGALPDTVGDAAVVVPTGDPTALAAGLARVLDDDALAAGLRARGRARAAAFTWDATVDAMLALYRRLSA